MVEEIIYIVGILGLGILIAGLTKTGQLNGLFVGAKNIVLWVIIVSVCIIALIALIWASTQLDPIKVAAVLVSIAVIKYLWSDKN